MEAVVTQPELLEIAFASKSDILCYGEATGAITVSSAGGTLPYRYSLDGQSWQDMADFTNLLAGKYQVLLQDARGCQAMLEISLVQPEQPLALSFQVTPVQCKETTTGAIKTTVSGGTSPYVYQWESLADKNPESFPDGQYSAADVSGLPDGDYVLTVTDAHGCQLRDTIAVTEPEIALQASITIQRNVSCFGLSDGFVQIEALGGYPPYRYAWQGRKFLDTLAYDDLAEGHYQMLVKDTMNCQVTIEVYISQPDVLAVSAEVLQHVSCFAGSDARFIAKVTGGTQSYRYSLDAGLTFQPEAIFAGYPKGVYNILVEDALGCTVSTQVNITEPVLLSASIDKVVPSACTQANGEALVVTQGGTPPYRYAWINQQGETVATNAYPKTLYAGVYDVYVIDAQDCQVHLSQIISDLDGPVSYISSFQDARCFTSADGSATVVAEGGSGGYTYLWSLQTGSLQTGSLQTGSLQTGSLQTGSLQTGSLQTGSLQTGSLQTGSLQTGSLQTGSLQTRSLQTGSLQTGSLQTGSLQTGSLQTRSDKTHANIQAQTSATATNLMRGNTLSLSLTKGAVRVSPR